jgi:hypothetical protein
MYVNSGIGQEQPRCTAQPDMCFNSFDSRDSARTLCQYGKIPTYIPGSCPPGHVIAEDDVSRFRPCDIAHFNICQAAADLSYGPQTAQQAAEEERGKEDNTMLYVMGGAAILAVGGIAYFMSKKKR